MRDLPDTITEPGIYIGLSEDVYFAAEALGSSDLKALYLDPESWWWETRPQSPLKPEAKEDGDALRIGKAVHMALLEGLEKYERHYAVRPSRKTYPGAMETIPQMKAWLRDRDLKVGGNRDELIERILEADPTALIWDAIVDGALAGRLPMSRAEDARLRLTRRFIERDEDLINELDPGLSELSVFWRDKVTGTMHRARFDRITPRRPWDLKTFTRRSNVTPRTGALRRAQDFSWHIQVASYWEAWDRLPALPVYGGTDQERETLAAIIDTVTAGTCTHWGWLFYPNNGAPSPVPLRLKRDGLITQEGENRLKDAKANYAAWVRLYGLESAWVETAGVQDIDDDTEGFGFWRAA